MDETRKEWSDERVFVQFTLEVRQRFVDANIKHRAEETADVERTKMLHPEWFVKHPDYPGMEVRDSFFYDIFDNCVFTYRYNSVQVTLPTGFAIYPDFVDMFAHTSVAWGFPNINAVIVDGKARVQIEVVLTDYWDDDRAASWPHLQELQASG